MLSEAEGLLGKALGVCPPLDTMSLTHGFCEKMQQEDTEHKRCPDRRRSCSSLPDQQPHQLPHQLLTQLTEAATGLTEAVTGLTEAVAGLTQQLKYSGVTMSFSDPR